MLIYAGPTLHWVCHSPSPYNDHLFRALSKSDRFRLQVHYLKESSGRDFWSPKKERGYSHRYFRRFPFDWRLLRDAICTPNTFFLSGCWQDPTSELVLLWRIFTGQPYAIWNDTPSPFRRNWLKGYLRSIFLRLVLRNARFVLGTGSPALQALQKMGASPSTLVDFPFCIDLSEFQYQERLHPSQQLVFGTSARLDSIKGIDIALRAFAQLMSSAPFRFRYRIAGAGPHEQALRTLASELGITKSVEFCGWLQQEQLPSFYQELDAYVHPARFEPYGVAVIEALASGLPVIASDQTMAARDRVRSGISGLLYSAENEAELAARIKEIASLSPSRLAEMRIAARAESERWAAQQAVTTIETILRSCDALNWKSLEERR